MKKKESLEKEVKEYRRQKDDANVTIRMSGKVIRHQNINYLKIYIMYVIQFINRHKQF